MRRRMPDLLALHGERDERRSVSSGTSNRQPVRQGRVSRVRRRTAARDAVNPEDEGTKAAAHYRARCSAAGESAARSCGSTDRAKRRAEPFGAASTRSSRIGSREADEFYDGAHSPEPHRHDERARRAPGVRRPALDQAVLSLRRQGLAGRRSRRSRASAEVATQRPQQRLDASLQPRRDLDAGQVGVSLVRGVGPRVSHDPVRAHRSGLRQGAARAVPARVVHAPQRAAARVRVGVLRRESAGPRLGRAGASTR